jgi:hypothetical protein
VEVRLLILEPRKSYGAIQSLTNKRALKTRRVAPLAPALSPSVYSTLGAMDATNKSLSQVDIIAIAREQLGFPQHVKVNTL